MTPENRGFLQGNKRTQGDEGPIKVVGSLEKNTPSEKLGSLRETGRGSLREGGMGRSNRWEPSAAGDSRSRGPTER